MRFAPLLLPMALLAAPLGAQTLEITAQPATAKIYRLKAQDNSLVEIGQGTARFKLEKNDPNTLVVRQEGYRDVRRTFSRDVKYKEKSFLIPLTTRLVKITSLPYDADIKVNGEPAGQRELELAVEEGQAVTVELVKRGFATLSRVYRWDKGGTMPPPQDRLELTDRQVALNAAPTGAEIFVNDQKVGEGDADVVVKAGTCATVRVQKAGWIPQERSFCNRDGLPESPIADRVTLQGRIVNVAGPEGARILVNQKQAAVGTYPVRVPEGSCVAVRVEQPGFLPYDREFCVQENAPAPPLDAVVTLKPDDSYAASVASDQANVNVTIEVGSGRVEEQAWKLLSSIVLSHFDVIENSDRETGYLRTAWQLKSYGDNNDVVIRTRIILKRANDDPLRYTVKIVSERNRFAGVSVKEDENFLPWDRLLNTYKDVISEMQSRLK